VKYFNTPANTTAFGLAYSAGAVEFIEAHPASIDFVEIPFEQLRHTPEVSSVQERVPVVLHCASMSVAGFVPPARATLEAIKREAARTKTPWIGEHLAFVSADPLDLKSQAAGVPISLTYTVCPQMSDETVERVAQNLAILQPNFGAPLILENSPQYFDVPGSTMPMVDFINAVSRRCRIGLLLDLTHFLITMLNTGRDAIREISRLPLETVIEIHISGLSTQSGVAWDDHATPAPAPVFALLERVLERVRPRAVTFEYNWSPRFPQTILESHIDRARQLLGKS
jgi:uncharacterized protein